MTSATGFLSPLSPSRMALLSIRGQETAQDEALSSERQCSRSQFIFYQAAPKAPSSFHLPAISAISSLVGIYAIGKHVVSPINQNKDRFRFDIVSSVPPEIGVKIFQFLDPADLCRLCLVCRRWLNLAQYDALKRKRLKYLHDNKEEYNRCKENFAIGSHTPAVVRSPTHPLLSSTPSPLSVVQPGNARRSRSISLSPVNTTLPFTFHTPQSTRLSRNARRLSMANESKGAQLSLFPDLKQNPPIAQNVSQDSWFLEHDALVGRRVNRCRLKRL